MRKTMLAVGATRPKSIQARRFPEPHAISALAALAQPTRLAIFRLLVKHEPIGITAGVMPKPWAHRTIASPRILLFLSAPGCSAVPGRDGRLSIALMSKACGR